MAATSTRREHAGRTRSGLVALATAAALALGACSGGQEAVPPQARLSDADAADGGTRAMVLVLREDMLAQRAGAQQQAVEEAQTLGDLRLYQLYDDPLLRRKLQRILYLHGTPAAVLDDPVLLHDTWQKERFEIGANPLQVELPVFVDQVSRQSRALASALARGGLFDEVKVVETYAPGFQRVAFGDSRFDFLIWPEPDYRTRSIRWHVIGRGALDKREVFNNPLTEGPNPVNLENWLDALGEKAQALQP